MHIFSISCGQGAPSLALIELARRGVFRADVVIVADTGGENDMLWSNGERSNAKTFFEQVTRPLSWQSGMDAYFVRTVDNNGVPLPDIMTDQRLNNDEEAGSRYQIDIPMFGSDMGRLKQSCTHKWKVRAVRQQLKRLGASTATTSLGLTMDEVHRMKQNTDVKWEVLQWPMLTHLKMYRARCEEILTEIGVPWIIRSQCDFCPHKNLYRWDNSSPETIEAAAAFEASFEGELFLTKQRIPLKEALSLPRQPSLFDDPCDSGYCFT